MTSPHETALANRVRLGRLVEQRKQRKGWTWTQIAARGIPLETLRRVRVDTAPLTEETCERLDHALQWKPGSTRDVLNGGNPKPLEGPTIEQERRVLDTPVGEVIYDIMRSLDADTDGLSGDERDELEEALAARIRADVTEFVELKRAQLQLRRHAAGQPPEREGSHEN